MTRAGKLGNPQSHGATDVLACPLNEPGGAFPVATNTVVINPVLVPPHHSLVLLATPKGSGPPMVGVVVVPSSDKKCATALASALRAANSAAESAATNGGR